MISQPRSPRLRSCLLVLALGAAPACGLGPNGAGDDGPGAGGKADGEDGTISLYRAGNRYGRGGARDQFLDEVLPVFARRCATCHGCIDSPCQLKMTSYEEISRGSNKFNVFGSRVFEADQTRLQDGRVTTAAGLPDHEGTIASWRAKEFYSVVDHGPQSIMYRLLDDAHQKVPEGGLSRAFELYEKGLKNRSFQCLGPDASGPAGPAESELAARPMPFGCPKIADEDWQVLAAWLREGAKGPTAEAEATLMKPRRPESVTKWENFFNQTGAKAAHSARFLYEHLFSTRLHLPDAAGEYYEIVRSFTPPGQPIDEIVTVRPNDDPAAAKRPPRGGGSANRLYYRLRKFTPLVVEKNHITWPLDDATMQRWQELLFDSDWGPGPIDPPRYDSRNPFVEFDRIPAPHRARFMQESSLYLIDAMVRGDVCNGSTATWAIRDHFWVWFLDPAADPSAQDPTLGLGGYDDLYPSMTTSGRERTYLQAFEARLRELRPQGLSLADLWDGGGADRGMVTVLRHATTATVHRGAFNGFPETSWILSFANFERLYYALVVGFNPWGSAAHRLDTWKYMSFIRADGEDLFVSLLPDAQRSTVRDSWTGDFGRFYDDLRFDLYSAGRASQVNVDPTRPYEDLIGQILDRLGQRVVGWADPINGAAPSRELPDRLASVEELERGFATLTGWQAPYARYLPNLTVVRVANQHVYTIVANRGYAYHNQVFMEDLARRPELDTLSVNRGLTGSRPELFIDVPMPRALDFLRALTSVDSETAWLTLLDAYALGSGGEEAQLIRRDTPEFWSFLDWMNEWNVAQHPVTAGLLDVSEYLWPRLVAPGTPTSDDPFEPNDTAAAAAPLSLGTNRLVLCPGSGWVSSWSEDWFAFTIDRAGTLAIEVAFDANVSDLDAVLEGDGFTAQSDAWSKPYESFARPVTPGTYRLGVTGRPGSTCQAYTVFASLHAAPVP
jgi:hypothetical protein